MKKVPMIMQMEAVECGAASLAMILAYYGKWLSLEKVRETCGVSRDGLSMRNILKAARYYGLEPSTYQVDAGELPGMEPAIIHWEFKHFVVYRGTKGDKVYLNDPGLGPVEIPMAEFRRSYTGIAMTFETTDRFEPGGHRVNILNYIVKNMGGAVTAFWLTFVFTLLVAVVALFTPLFTGVFLDEILSGRNANWATVFFCLMGAVAAFHFLVVFLQQRYSKRIAGQLSLHANIRFLQHLMRLPMNFFSMRFAGDLQQRQYLSRNIPLALVEVLAPQAINIALLAVYLVLMFSYNHVLTLIGILAALVNLGVLRYYATKRLNKMRSTLQSDGKYFSATVSSLENIESIKAAGAEMKAFENWVGIWSRKFNNERAVQLQQAQMSLLPTLTSQMLNAAVLLIGAWYILQGEFTIGMLMAFQGFMTAFMDPVGKVVAAGQRLMEMRSQMERVDDVMNYPEEKNAPVVATGPDKLVGEVELRNVTFGYSPTQPPIIKDFNLHLQPGQSVALVGGSGCGKSTIAKLIAGLYKPWSGEILFDGRPADQISREEITNSLSMVDQQIVLFEDTVTQNIRMWDRSMEEFTVLMACRDAQLYQVIVNRPNGFATRVMHNGNNFSGGQRQRIEIATALAREPIILVMDEATSALDPNTEDLLMESIRNQGITQIVVAHRLSTIRDCDQIIVLDHGNIVQRGTHDELISVDGLYKKLMDNC